MSNDNGKIQIDKGVPIPSVSGHGGFRYGKYPWREMEVGDSFFAPVKKTGAIYYGEQKRTGHKFTSRTRTENGVKGVRVWRVA